MFSLAKLTKQEKDRWTLIFAALILFTMFLIAFFSSKGIFGDPGDSGTVDEIAHIPSGFTYIKDQDFRLNPEHPPLAKAIAGIPLVLKGFTGPEDSWTWPGINQWEAGWQMIYREDNNPARLLIWARFPMMLLMIGLGAFLFKWARELFGRKVGLLVLLLFAFYPDVIAHGRLVTTDVAAAFGYVITLYYFDKLFTERSKSALFKASLAFALAQLLKFSAFLLFGILLVLAVIRSYLDAKSTKTKFMSVAWSYFKIYVLVCMFSLIIVWLVYLPFVWKTPVGIEHEVIERNLTQDPRTLILRNFLHLFEGNPILRGLGHYLLGIFLVVARVGGGNATFALGQVAEKSIPWYFPFAWIVKTPLSIILLTFASIAALSIKSFRKGSFWKLAVILSPVIVYWAFTLKGSLNIGIRHLIPTIPFVLLFIGWAVHKVLRYRRYANITWSIVGLLAALMIYHTISYFPNYIAYFNNFVPRDKRYSYLIDSSLDWGQDMLRLKKYIDDNSIDSIKIDYFGGSVPSYYIPQYEEWHSSYGPTTGWLAVSATYFQSSKLYGPKEGKWSYQWLEKQTPKTIIGGSILVYNITEQDIINHPPKSPYPITKLEFPGSIKTETEKVGL